MANKFITFVKKFIIKAILICVNTVIFIFGIAIIIGGSKYRSDIGYMEDASDEAVGKLEFSVAKFNNAPNIILAAGCFIVFVGICGCCAAFEVKIITYIYIVVLAVIALLMIAFGAYGIILSKRRSNQKEMIEFFQAMIDDYPANKESLAHFQQDFKCCGGEGRADYTSRNMTVPDSCWTRTTGCGEAVNDYLGTKVYHMSMFFIAIALLFFIIIIFCLWLVKLRKKKQADSSAITDHLKPQA